MECRCRKRRNDDAARDAADEGEASTTQARKKEGEKQRYRETERETETETEREREREREREIDQALTPVGPAGFWCLGERHPAESTHARVELVSQGEKAMARQMGRMQAFLTQGHL